MEKWVGRVGGVWRELLLTMNSTNLTPEMILHPLIPPWSVLVGIVIAIVLILIALNKACQSSTERNTYKNILTSD